MVDSSARTALATPDVPHQSQLWHKIGGSIPLSKCSSKDEHDHRKCHFLRRCPKLSLQRRITISLDNILHLYLLLVILSDL